MRDKMNLKIEPWLNSVELIQNPCPICAETKVSGNDKIISKTGYPGLAFKNVICKNCALIRISPRMSPEGYAEFYKKDFFEYLDPYNRPAYVNEIENTINDNVETPTKKMILPFFESYVSKDGDVLDIGAGFGQVIYLLKKKKNINFVGLEPDPFSRKIAKEKIGIELLPDTIEEYLAKNGQQKFDLIVLNQTFEHLLEPLKILQSLSKILKKDGVIYIGVPNAFNPQIPIKLFYQLAHTFNYTPYTMSLFADLSGLKIIKIKDPIGYPLEVMLAHKESYFDEIPDAQKTVGKGWKNVISILNRKKHLNIVRGLSKKIISSIIGQKGKEKVRALIDKVIGYKY